jgi:serine beta-lactamase-like protein LACTB
MRGAVLAACCVVAAVGFAAEEVRQSTPAESVDYAAVVARLAEIVEAELQRGILTGVSVALVDDQRVICVRGFGWANKARRIPAAADTVYRAGSISKLFTAMAAMQLVEQGRLDIDKPLPQIDPQFRIVVPFDDAGAMTLRQLMCHRSGLVRESPVGGYFDPSQPTIADSVASLAPCVLVYRPNTHTKYSNSGPTVVGQCVALAAGMPYVKYQQQHVLGPMGMNSSAFLLGDELRKRLATGSMLVADGRGGSRLIDAPRFELGTIPAGNLYTTAEDLARFLCVLFAEGRAGDRQVLKPETLRQMFTPQLVDEKTGYGLAFVVGKYRDYQTIGHMGAVYGFTSSLIGIPRHKIAAVVLSNDDIALGPVRKLTDAAMDLLIEAKLGQPPPPAGAAAALLTADAALLSGDYESESYWARIDASEGRLEADISGQRTALSPTGPDKFLADGRYVHQAPVVFQRDIQGRATGFSALEQQFRRVDPAAVSPPPAEWQEFLGSYGPEFIPLVVSVKHGHLYAMTENMVDYRLTPLCRTVFRLPPGMYVDEQLVFQTGGDGRVHSVILANMVLRRKAEG